MPWRTSFACRSSSTRRCGERESMEAHISARAAESSEAGPCSLAERPELRRCAGHAPDAGGHRSRRARVRGRLLADRSAARDGAVRPGRAGRVRGDSRARRGGAAASPPGTSRTPRSSGSARSCGPKPERDGDLGELAQRGNGAGRLRASRPFTADAGGPRFWSYRSFPNHRAAGSPPGDVLERLAATAPIAPLRSGRERTAVLSGLRAPFAVATTAAGDLAAHRDALAGTRRAVRRGRRAGDRAGRGGRARRQRRSRARRQHGGRADARDSRGHPQRRPAARRLPRRLHRGAPLHVQRAVRRRARHGAAQDADVVCDDVADGLERVRQWGDYATNPDGSLAFPGGWFIAGTFVFTYSGTRASDGGTDTLAKPYAATNWDPARDYGAFPPDRPGAGGTSAGSFAPWDVRSELRTGVAGRSRTVSRERRRRADHRRAAALRRGTAPRCERWLLRERMSAASRCSSCWCAWRCSRWHRRPRSARWRRSPATPRPARRATPRWPSRERAGPRAGRRRLRGVAGRRRERGALRPLVGTRPGRDAVRCRRAAARRDLRHGCGTAAAPAGVGDATTRRPSGSASRSPIRADPCAVAADGTIPPGDAATVRWPRRCRRPSIRPAGRSIATSRRRPGCRRDARHDAVAGRRAGLLAGVLLDAAAAFGRAERARRRGPRGRTGIPGGGRRLSERAAGRAVAGRRGHGCAGLRRRDRGAAEPAVAHGTGGARRRRAAIQPQLRREPDDARRTGLRAVRRAAADPDTIGWLQCNGFVGESRMSLRVTCASSIRRRGAGAARAVRHAAAVRRAAVQRDLGRHR